MAVPACAEYLATTPGVIYQMVSKRTIPFVKMGTSVRFNVEKIDRWIEERSVDGESILRGKSLL